MIEKIKKENCACKIKKTKNFTSLTSQTKNWELSSATLYCKNKDYPGYHPGYQDNVFEEVILDSKSFKMSHRVSPFLKSWTEMYPDAAVSERGVYSIYDRHVFLKRVQGFFSFSPNRYLLSSELLSLTAVTFKESTLCEGSISAQCSRVCTRTETAVCLKLRRPRGLLLTNFISAMKLRP